MEEVYIKYEFPCRRGCGKPVIEGKSCCSQDCRDKMQNCDEKGCKNATEPITYQGQDYAGFTDKCRQYGGRPIYEGQVIEDKPDKVVFVHTVKGWIQSSPPSLTYFK